VRVGSRSLPRKCLSTWFSEPRASGTLFLSPLYNCAVLMLKVNIGCGVFLFSCLPVGRCDKLILEVGECVKDESFWPPKLVSMRAEWLR